MRLGRSSTGIEVEAQHVAAAVEIARVEQQRALAVVDARLRARRQHQAAQQRRDAFRIDREFERRERLVDRAVALAGLQFEQLVGIDRDRVGLDRRRGRDRARDDLALHQQALHARVDQAGAELRQIEDADDQREQAGDVEQDDAPRQARRALRDEEAPAPRPKARRTRRSHAARDARHFASPERASATAGAVSRFDPAPSAHVRWTESGAISQMRPIAPMFYRNRPRCEAGCEISLP